MVAATRIITQEDAIRSIEKHKGRPTVLETAELVAGAQRGESFRRAVNRKYAVAGLAFMTDIMSEAEVKKNFVVHDRILYQGAFEQLGRFVYDDTLDRDEIQEVAEIVLNETRAGVKSKDLERRLKEMRRIYKAARANY